MEKKNNENKSGVITSKHPEWLNTIVPPEYEDEDLLKIIMFFVFYSPCPGVSKRGIPLSAYGWKNKPWYSPEYLKNKLDKIIFGDGDRLFYMSSKKDFENMIRGKDFGEDFYLYRSNQRIAITNCGSENSSKYMSLFYHIRNSLAHGRLAMYPAKNGDIMFIMEDGEDVKGEEDKFEVKARIVILKSTLLNIIQRLKTAPEEEKNYEDDILLAIKNKVNTKSKIIRELEIDSKIYDKTIYSLKEKSLIEYNGKCWKIIN